ncbi:MAG: glycerol-3-phosphate acyltransferase, partial [Acidimicrobiales bacterium]
GTMPFSNLAARRLAGVDLRGIGSGTVSGTGLYEVTGFGPLAVVGCLELAKGAFGPVLAGRHRRRLAAGAAFAGICGHNWSPWLGWSGGRGLSPALGAGLVLAPEATATLGLGLGAGRIARHTGLSCGLGLAALFPLLSRTRGRDGTAVALAIALPLAVKRLTGNGRPKPGSPRSVYLSRLLLDRDER